MLASGSRTQSRVVCVDRAPFIHQANYAVIMFEQRMGAHKYTQLHATASTLAATLNSANYSALLGFCQGNLAEMSSFAHARPAAAAQPHAQAQTAFNDAFSFEPPAGDKPTFYMTASVPDLTVNARDCEILEHNLC